MVQINQITSFFPYQIQDNPVFYKYMLKEYIQLQLLDYLSSTRFVKNLTFIGGTNLRLVKGIDRFSEDLDFDCKAFSYKEFINMTDEVITFLKRNGYKIITKDRKDTKLNAFRRSLYFPEFLFELGLSGHREERFLIKIESEDQGIEYKRTIANIKGCGYFFPFPVPSDKTLCSMKITAMLNRQKGRDFYDVMFLLSQSKPNYEFLSAKTGISNLQELKDAVERMLQTVDLVKKTKDFEHLLFNKENSKRILRIGEFFQTLE